MMLGGIKDKPKQIGDNQEIEALKKDVAELKKTVEMLKYGLIFFALMYMYNQFNKK